MPKVVTSSRRIRGHHHLQGPTTSSEQASSPPTSSVLWNAPRKVSFEDGHQSSSSFASQQSSVVGAGSSSNSLASTASSCKSSLRRKAPSVCLVGLASLSSSSQHEATSSSTEALHCLSPTPSTDLDNNNSLHNSPTTTTATQPHGQSTAPSSPWGHFVDILVPLDEEESPPPSPMDNNDNNNSNKRSFFGFLHVPNHDDDEGASATAPSFLPRQSPLAKRHKHRRCSSHPYGLQPRHHRRRQRRQQQPPQPSKPSFLPGFLLDESSPSEKTPTPQEVEQALRRLQV